MTARKAEALISSEMAKETQLKLIIRIKRWISSVVKRDKKMKMQTRNSKLNAKDC